MSDSRAVRPEVDEYLRYIESGRQLSAHTVAAYRRDLAELCEFLDRRESGDWADVARDDLRAFIGDLARRDLARRSIARKLSAARSFLRWLHREGRIESNPGRTVRSPSRSRSAQSSPCSSDRRMPVP